MFLQNPLVSGAKYCHLFCSEKAPHSLQFHISFTKYFIEFKPLYIKIYLSNVIYFKEMLKNHYSSLSSAFRVHLQFSSGFSISLHIRKPKLGTYLYIKTVIKCHVRLEHLNYSSDFWSLIPLVSLLPEF